MTSTPDPALSVESNAPLPASMTLAFAFRAAHEDEAALLVERKVARAAASVRPPADVGAGTSLGAMRPPARRGHCGDRRSERRGVPVGVADWRAGTWLRHPQRGPPAFDGAGRRSGCRHRARAHRGDGASFAADP